MKKTFTMIAITFVVAITVTVVMLSSIGAIKTPQAEPLIEALSSITADASEVVFKATGKELDVTVTKVADDRYLVVYKQNTEMEVNKIKMYNTILRFEVDHWDVEVQKEVCQNLM